MPRPVQAVGHRVEKNSQQHTDMRKVSTCSALLARASRVASHMSAWSEQPSLHPGRCHAFATRNLRAEKARPRRRAWQSSAAFRAHNIVAQYARIDTFDMSDTRTDTCTDTRIGMIRVSKPKGVTPKITSQFYVNPLTSYINPSEVYPRTA